MDLDPSTVEVLSPPVHRRNCIRIGFSLRTGLVSGRSPVAAIHDPRASGLACFGMNQPNLFFHAHIPPHW